RHDEAEKVLGNSLILTLLNCAVYLTIFAVFLDEILIAFGASEATLPYARDFMTWILPGMFMTNMSFSFNNIMRSSGYPVKAMVTMFIGAGVNIILVPITIYYLGLGIKGAAIATDLAMTTSAIFVMKHFLNPGSTLHFKRGIYRLRWHIVMGIISIGAAPSIVNACASIINMLINRNLYAYGGDLAVGAAGIFVTYTSLMTTVIVGICQGMQPVVGYNYGAGQIERLKRAFYMAVGAASVICCLGTTVAFCFPQGIAAAFTTDPGLREVTAMALTTSMVAFWFVGFQIVATTFFQSIGRAAKSIFLSLIRQVIFLIPLLIYLPPIYGLRGVWLAFPTSDVLATVVTALMMIFQMREINAMAMRARLDPTRH
ncbi:MAG: polysaccharide biosynthesis C-terminal domain-containing protein, partial [Muribaculaceae bacterium]|nr:polysaccharide biosynthesis C-terminal domain-containing protein [Muribaculaceae bacterium]